MDKIIEELKNSSSKNRVDELISSLLNTPSYGTLVNIPNPKSLDLFSILINHTLPELDDGGENDDCNPLILELFRSLTGISSLVARISALAQVISSQESKLVDQISYCTHMNLLCWILGNIISGPHNSGEVKQRQSSAYSYPAFLLAFKRISIVTTENKKGSTTARLYYKELVSLFSGSKILEAISIANHWLDQYKHQLTKIDIIRYDKWKRLSSGSEYSRVLAREIYEFYAAYSAVDSVSGLESGSALGLSPGSNSGSVMTETLERALRLGYPTVIADELCNNDQLTGLLNIYKIISRPSEKWYFMETCLLPFLQEKYLRDQMNGNNNSKVSAVASILKLFLQECKSPPIFSYAESVRVNFNMRRAIVAISGQGQQEDNDRKKLSLLIQAQFKGLIERWGNLVGINHNPVLIQEAQTQLLILCIKSFDISFLKLISSSSEYLNAVTNRLSASMEKARLYGAIVAQELSRRADAEGKPLKFDMEELYDDDLKNWLKVVATEEKIKLFDLNNKQLWKSLQNNEGNERVELVESMENIILSEKRNKKSSNSMTDDTSIHRNSQGPKIIELNDDSDVDNDDDKDLQAYPIPDSDEEDSDDDPALAEKKKFSAPVYIKDLLEYLKADNYDKNRLGLIYGADLIRRKARYGQELQLYAHPLSEQLAGMKDTFEMENFNENRLIALSALVASCPLVVPTYLAQLVFTADYSLQQRINILSSIALGARELSGHDDIEAVAKAKNNSQPPKLLPPEVHKLFANPIERNGNTPNNRLISTNMSLLMNVGSSATPFQADPVENYGDTKAIDFVTADLQEGLLKQVSVKAKDEIIGGPKVLRISSKLLRQREISVGSAGDDNNIVAGHKIITNQFAKMASRRFFSPLIGQWYASGGGINAIGTYSDILVAHFLKTLTLILHAAYPSSSDMITMSSEFLDILLSQRAAATAAVPVLESVVTGILIILEVNDGEFLVATWPRQIVELKMWLEDSWENVPDERVQALAAGVLYRLTETTTKWERRLLGEFTSLEGGY